MMKAENIRLLKNTIAQYIKVVISAISGLVAVPILLRELGVDDYGIYTVIGGLVAFLGVLNATMVVSTQRFISIEIANGNTEKVTRYYSSSVKIHFILSIIILFFAETIGLYIVNHVLKIPEDTMIAANVVYQSTVFTFLLNVLSVPQQALLIAYEKIYISSIIGIIDSVLRLGAAIVLILFAADKLIVYSIIIVGIAVFIRIAYNIIAIRTTKVKFERNVAKDDIKSLIGFAWWNLFGGIAMIGKTQGLNIILNLFKGPAINASFGIANQVNSQLMVFCNSIFQSSNSQTIQAWKNKETSRLDFLIIRVTKMAFILFLLLTTPLFVLSKDVLQLWLGKVPIYSSIFLQLMLLNSYVELFSTPLMTIMQATGKIKHYFIIISSILLMILPISYYALYEGYSPSSVLIITIIINAIILVARALFCRSIGQYNVRKYFIQCVIPAFSIIFVTLIIPYYINITYINKIVQAVIIEVVSIFLCFRFLLSSADRHQIKKYVFAKF